jgi:hypothetical protein
MFLEGKLKATNPKIQMRAEPVNTSMTVATAVDLAMRGSRYLLE